LCGVGRKTLINQSTRAAVNLGNGHLPLSRSSATNFTSTDLQRSSSDRTASWVIAPSSWLDAAVDRMTNENWSRVSKQAFANVSRSLRLDSVSEEESAQHSACIHRKRAHIYKQQTNFIVSIVKHISRTSDSVDISDVCTYFHILIL